MPHLPICCQTQQLKKQTTLDRNEEGMNSAGATRDSFLSGALAF
jgi:hypothetical protein